MIIRLQGEKSKIFPAFLVFHFKAYGHELFSLSVHEIQIHKKRPHPVGFGMRSVPVLVEIGHLAGHKTLNAHAGRVGDGDVLSSNTAPPRMWSSLQRHRAVEVESW